MSDPASARAAAYETIRRAIDASPVIAVLRGISPDEALPVGDALIGAGVRVLEVTLDSPQPFESIALLAKRHGDAAAICAGTVLRAEAVISVAAAGGVGVIAPNFSPAVVGAAQSSGLAAGPGVMTPTEAFAALEAGADFLKLFPGDAVSPPVVKGLRAVLPKDVALAVTGGVNAETIPAFLNAGATAVGLGSALYKPGKSAAAIGEDAAAFVAAAAGARG